MRVVCRYQVYTLMLSIEFDKPGRPDLRDLHVIVLIYLGAMQHLMPSLKVYTYSQQCTLEARALEHCDSAILHVSRRLASSTSLQHHPD